MSRELVQKINVFEGPESSHPRREILACNNDLIFVGLREKTLCKHHKSQRTSVRIDTTHHSFGSQVRDLRVPQRPERLPRVTNHLITSWVQRTEGRSERPDVSSRRVPTKGLLPPTILRPLRSKYGPVLLLTRTRERTLLLLFKVDVGHHLEKYRVTGFDSRGETLVNICCPYSI